MPTFKITVEDTCFAQFDIVAPDLAEARILAEERVAYYDLAELHWQRIDDEGAVITSVTHTEAE